MKASRYGIAILGFLALALAGCDSFSLPKVLTRPEDRVLALAVDKATTERLVGSVGLIPSGGTAPYTFDLAPVALAPKTNTQGTGTITNLTYNAGGAIGRMRLTVTDSMGDSASAYVDVLPPAPTMTVSRSGGDANASIDYSFDTTISDSVVILRSFNGGAIEPLTTSTTPGTFSDNGPLNPVQPYTYRIYALSGDYASAFLDRTI